MKPPNSQLFQDLTTSNQTKKGQQKFCLCTHTYHHFSGVDFYFFTQPILIVTCDRSSSLLFKHKAKPINALGFTIPRKRLTHPPLQRATAAAASQPRLPRCLPIKTARGSGHRTQTPGRCRAQTQKWSQHHYYSKSISSWFFWRFSQFSFLQTLEINRNGFCWCR